MAQPLAIRASDAEREAVAARLGDSDFFWPIVPMLAWGAVLLGRRRPRQRRLTT